MPENRPYPPYDPPISETLDRLRESVEKTEFEAPIPFTEEVTADALDVAEARGVASGVAKNFAASKPPVPTSTGQTIPLKVPSDPVRVTLTPEQAAKWNDAMNKHGKVSKWSKLGKFLGPVAKKLPGVNAAVMAYETASLINSPEARQKARDQAEKMFEWGYSPKGVASNVAQSLLDPVGTIFAAGEAGLDSISTSLGEFFRGNSERSKLRGAIKRGELTNEERLKSDISEGRGAISSLPPEKQLRFIERRKKFDAEKFENDLKAVIPKNRASAIKEINRRAKNPPKLESWIDHKGSMTPAYHESLKKPVTYTFRDKEGRVFRGLSPEEYLKITAGVLRAREAEDEKAASRNRAIEEREANLSKMTPKDRKLYEEKLKEHILRQISP